MPPGKSTLIIPVKQLYVGEKSRPGRMLILSGITRLVFGIGDNPPAPLFMDNVRLERDDTPARVSFDGPACLRLRHGHQPGHGGIHADHAGDAVQSRAAAMGSRMRGSGAPSTPSSPTRSTRTSSASKRGGLAVDVPNGQYRVFVNIDSPSGFWGEYQTYRQRTILAEGRPVVRETMDFEAFKAKYFRFWNVEDLPGDDTFDKYQKAYFQEKRFDVDVTDGQLNLEFQGENWACCVSAVVIFPVAKAARGEAFLEYVEARRRFYFDNYFKRVLPAPTGDPLRPTDDDRRRGFVVFQRDSDAGRLVQRHPCEAEVGRSSARARRSRASTSR